MAALAIAVDLDKAGTTGPAKADLQLPEQLEQLDMLLDQLLNHYSSPA
jgi:hypothetical protein